MELLQALTHEIRTPLTTIRTSARLLLRNPNLSPAMAQSLQAIDRECTDQIDRMELIFRAIELETAASQAVVQLVPMSFAQVLQTGIPRWKKQAERRNVELDVVLPPSLPQVVSDPALFDRVLAGLMEKFTSSLPMGGKIRLEVTTAGNQLKLQFHNQAICPANPFKSLGHLLVFQPETGSLSLNLKVTKNLFQALGGKLIVRQRSQQEEIFTIFLPLGNARSSKPTQTYQVHNI
jgi:signal transduction histidine kinase